MCKAFTILGENRFQNWTPKFFRGRGGKQRSRYINCGSAKNVYKQVLSKQLRSWISRAFHRLACVRGQMKARFQSLILCLSFCFSWSLLLFSVSFFCPHFFYLFPFQSFSLLFLTTPVTTLAALSLARLLTFHIRGVEQESTEQEGSDWCSCFPRVVSISVQCRGKGSNPD